MNLKYFSQWLGLGCLILQVGCNQLASIEYRDDRPVKQKLSVMQHAPIKTKWSVPSGKGRARSYSNLQLVAYDQAVITVDHRGTLVAIDTATGEKKWSQTLNRAVTAGPSLGLSPDRLYVGTRDASVLAICAKTGGILWETQVSGEILAPPQAKGDQVIVNSLDGSITVLNQADGRILWYYSQPDQRGLSMVLRQGSVPVLTDTQIINGFSSGHLVSLRRRDGILDWNQPVVLPKGNSDIQRMVDLVGQPLVHNEQVYVLTYSGALACYQEKTGQLIWSRELAAASHGLTGNFEADQNNLYLSDQSGCVWCLGADQGEVHWKSEEMLGRRLTKPVIQGNLIVLADEDGYIHWLDQVSGHIVARHRLKTGSIETEPLVHGHQLFVLNQFGRLAALELDQKITQNFDKKIDNLS